MELGNLLFTFIDRAFLEGDRGFYLIDTQRWSTVAGIIAFPVFLLLARYINKQVELNPFKRVLSSTPLAYLSDALPCICCIARRCHNSDLQFARWGFNRSFCAQDSGGRVDCRLLLYYYLLDLRKEEEE